MKKSARVLGEEVGLTAQEMNFLFKEEGFLDGAPGNYTVTEKGEPYAKEQDYHRGPGGYSHYNRDWTVRTWDDSIMEKLDTTDDRKKEIRHALSVAKQKTNESEDERAAIEHYSYSNEDEGATDVYKDVLVEVISALLVAATMAAAYKSAPYVKRWWSNKAVPNLKK